MAPSSAPALARESPDTELLEPIRDVSHAVVQRMVPHIVAAGMVKATFWPLHYLDQGTTRHPGELARRLGVTPAACTSTVDQLVELGYVVRRPTEGDRRQVALAVTPKGHRALEQIWKGFDATLREVLVGIPSRDIEVTARTLRVIAARLKADGPDAPGEARP